jgi:putative FmdB family regulatory protein
MPIYAQRCDACGARFEIIALSFDAPRPCPQCSSLATTNIIELCAFRVSTRKRTDDVKRGKAHNPYENLTLDHVKDERGKPVKVNSEAELHAAEKRYGFVHAASWGLEDKPPQHDPDAGNIAKSYKRKFNRDPSAYDPARVTGVSVGVAKGADDTLAPRPNSGKNVGT